VPGLNRGDGGAGEAGRIAGGKRAAPVGSFEAMGIDGTWAEVNLIAYNDDDQASTLHSLPRPPANACRMPTLMPSTTAGSSPLTLMTNYCMSGSGLSSR